MKENSTQDCKLTDKDWLAMAKSFEIEGQNFVKGVQGTFINKIPQIDGSIKWSVIHGSCALTKEGVLEYELMPSSRTDEYLERARFDSKEEAYEAWLKYKEEEIKERGIK